METLDNSAFVFEFLAPDPDFKVALEVAFPNEEIVSRSSFSGKEVLSIVGTLSKGFLSKLLGFLVGRKVKIQIGKNSIELSGYSVEEIPKIETSLLRLIREARGS